MRNGHYEFYEVDVARWRRALQPAKPLDELARFTAREEAASRARRAARSQFRDQTEQLIRESRELTAAAERRLAARDTPQGQLLAAARRGRW